MDLDLADHRWGNTSIGVSPLQVVPGVVLCYRLDFRTCILLSSNTSDIVFLVQEIEIQRLFVYIVLRTDIWNVLGDRSRLRHIGFSFQLGVWVWSLVWCQRYKHMPSDIVCKWWKVERC